MSKAVKNIIILGGGSAGWLTAAVIAAEHGEGLNITLVESPNVPIIGVGEGTWPSMRDTLRKIGVSEQAFITECDAPAWPRAARLFWVDVHGGCSNHFGFDSGD